MSSSAAAMPKRSVFSALNFFHERELYEERLMREFAEAEVDSLQKEVEELRRKLEEK